MLPRGAAAVLALVAPLLLAAPGDAYVRTVTRAGAPVWWPATCLRLEVHVGAPPGVLAAGTFLEAARAAAAAWSRGAVSCTGLDLRVVPSPEPEAPASLDGTSRVTFRRKSWCREPRAPGEACYDPAALAITSVFVDSESGVILDTDVEINAVGHLWADLTAGGAAPAGAHDIQNTLTHELGHVIGLDHNCHRPGSGPRRSDHLGRPVPDCDAAEADVRGATMFPAVSPGDLERRTLGEDERRGLCAIYPAGRGAAACRADPPPDVVGGCALGRRAEPAAAALLACALLLAALRRGRRGRRRTGGASR